MFTNYWTLDAFIIASLLLCIFVIVIFAYHEYHGSGELAPYVAKEPA
ncbi:MAG: hypothetical protein ACRCT7_01675 [Shewanella sp.]|nr:hypothetical protein [Shewanella sp. SNU WT4]